MTDVILRISGMDCGACAVRIVRALQGLPGLREVSVSDTAGCACLTYDEMAVDLGEIARCVQRAGFDVPVGTAELRCPGADAGAEARLRAVFGVRSVARAGDTFTVPLLFLFGALQSFLPRGWMKYIVKGSAVLVVTLGLSMLVKGIRLFGM